MTNRFQATTEISIAPLFETSDPGHSEVNSLIANTLAPYLDPPFQRLGTTKSAGTGQRRIKTNTVRSQKPKAPREYPGGRFQPLDPESLSRIDLAVRSILIFCSAVSWRMSSAMARSKRYAANSRPQKRGTTAKPR